MIFFTYVLIPYLIAINVIAFIFYGIDKLKAKNRSRRIPERVLLGFARFGGGIGCGLGMLAFRHKTQHKEFRITIPVWIIIWAVVFVALHYLLS